MRFADARFAASIMISCSHDAVVDRLAVALHDEHVGAADALAVAAVDLAVGEGRELHLAERHVRGTRRSPPRAPRCRCPAKSISFFLETSSMQLVSLPLGRSVTRASASASIRSLAGVVARTGDVFQPFDPGRHALGQRAGWHVAGDDRAGAGVGAVADLDRRDEHRVRPDARVGADLRAVLVPAVVVGGDGAGADVGARARSRRRPRRRGAAPSRPRRSRSSSISTNVPTCAPSAEAGARPQRHERADGGAGRRSRLSRATRLAHDAVARPRSCRRAACRDRSPSPLPTTVRPSRIVPGSSRTSGSSSTAVSM